MTDAERIKQVEALLDECKEAKYIFAYDIDEKYINSSTVQEILVYIGFLLNIFDSVVEEARKADVPLEVMEKFINSCSGRLARITREIVDGKWKRADNWESLKKEILEWADE